MGSGIRVQMSVQAYLLWSYLQDFHSSKGSCMLFFAEKPKKRGSNESIQWSLAIQNNYSDKWALLAFASAYCEYTVV